MYVSAAAHAGWTLPAPVTLEDQSAGLDLRGRGLLPGPWALGFPLECFPDGFGSLALKCSCCLSPADYETSKDFHTQSSKMWAGNHENTTAVPGW